MSEIAIMAWRSREMSAAMMPRKKAKQTDQARDPIEVTTDLPDYGLQHKPKPHGRVVEHEDSYELPKDVNNGVRIPKQFFNEEGEIDLSRATGPQAVGYLRAVGINIPTMFR